MGYRVRQGEVSKRVRVGLALAKLCMMWWVRLVAEVWRVIVRYVFYVGEVAVSEGGRGDGGAKRGVRRRLRGGLTSLGRCVGRLSDITVTFSDKISSAFLLGITRRMLKSGIVTVAMRSNSFPGERLGRTVTFYGGRNVHRGIYRISRVGVRKFSRGPPGEYCLYGRTLFRGVKTVTRGGRVTCITRNSGVSSLNSCEPKLRTITRLKMGDPLHRTKLAGTRVHRLSGRVKLSA